jgi:integrase/recombinase XerD
MPDFDLRRLRPQTQTVSVYTRHSSGCPKTGEPQWRRCRCSKYLYLLKDGKRQTISAKTRSWDKAEDKAQEIRDAWDPVKQKMRELEEQQKAHLAEEMAIEAAVERWLKSIYAEIEKKHTRKKYDTAARKIRAWAQSKNFVSLSQVTTDALDEWKTQWKPKAKHPDDRMSKTTAGRHLEKVKAFFTYCQRMGWIKASPAHGIKAIKPDETETLPLLGGRYEQVLEATYKYDADMRPDDQYGQELRALMELMRWSGLRISDALMVAKSRIVGNRFTLRTVKSGTKLTVILPDHVVADLHALPTRPTVDPRYFFWSGKSEIKSLTGQWQRKLGRLNKYLTLVDYEERPLRFHSHQLRDTFAVEHLLAGTSMQDLSKMLGHKSIRVTEKHYAPWVPERQAQLEEKMTQALKKMGATVSLGANPL